MESYQTITKTLVQWHMSLRHMSVDDIKTQYVHAWYLMRIMANSWVPCPVARVTDWQVAKPSSEAVKPRCKAGRLPI